MTILTLNNTRPNPANLPAGNAAHLATAVYRAQQAALPWLLTLTVAGTTATVPTGLVPAGTASYGTTEAQEVGTLAGNGAADYLALGGRNVVGYTVAGPWTGSIQFQASIDGVHWVAVGAPVTALSTALGTIADWYAPYLDLVVSTGSGSAALALWLTKA